MIEELHVIFKGRVQGVGFRWTVSECAERMGLAGTVKNLENGDVELVVQGPKETLKTFLHLIQTNPGSATISSLKTSYSPATKPFKNFHIIF